MWGYVAPLRDMQFVLDEWLEAGKDWAQIPAFAELGADTVQQILAAAADFAAHTLQPINLPADRSGCRWEAGDVRTPQGFVQAYRQFREAGWPALACDPEYGGQGLPLLLNAALYEMLMAANHAWSMYPGIVHGAYDCLRTHASREIRSRYLPKIVSGEWLCTMCLTEPQAGSDVGLVRTRAEPRADGTYSISGTKIFISGGEHDLTDNILHLVLARLPDAPAGTRGISLFLVPKRLPTAGSPANALRCEGIEKKMGIKGSATCVMNFGGAQGWLIGEPHRGLAAMFVMMNAARLHVGLQGLGHAEMAYQNARRHAAERRQMRSPERPADAGEAHPGGADPIDFHPAMRRTLMTLRALVEGERALGYWSAHLLDLAEHDPDESRRAAAQDLLSLLTPVIKSFFTENGFNLSSAALQVFGGYGYIQDYGIEQSLRDSRIAMIYEGSNEIQGVDFLVRKVIGDGGRKFKLLLQWIADEAAACRAVPALEQFGAELDALTGRWQKVTGEIIAEAGTAPAAAYGIAGDHLRVAGLCLLGACWARTARVSMARSQEPFYRGKLDAARFYFDCLLPEAGWRLDLIGRRHLPLPWVRPTE